MTDTRPAIPSSTILLLRDSATGPEIFMVKRHHQIDFASGALVFPGGKLEPGDEALAADPTRYTPPSTPGGPDLPYRIGAIRETFEECGVLLARKRGSMELLDGAAISTLDASEPFAAMLARHDLVLATDCLTPYAHWVTPTFIPKRFETWFFVADVPAGQIGRHDGSEAVDSLWITARDALTGAAAGTHTVIFATRLNLEKIADCDSCAAVLERAASMPIVTVQPETVMQDGVQHLRIPAAAGYGGEVFPI